MSASVETGSAVVAAGDDCAHLKHWPLSYAQALLWFLAGRWPAADMQNRLTVAMVEPLPAGTGPDRLRAVLAQLLDRHEPLRSRVVTVDGEPFQVVLPAAEPPLEVVDLRGLPTAVAAAERDAVVQRLHVRPVSVYECPPVRFLLVRHDREPRLAVVAHHLFFDYWSAHMLRDELVALLAGDPVPPAGEIQYVDYVSWERERLVAGDAAAGVDWWVDRLADLPPLRLDAAARRPWLPRGDARRASGLLDPAAVRGLEALAGRHRATLYMITASCFLGLLAHDSGLRDVAMPTLFSGRITPELNDVLGYFDNILFLRQRYEPEMLVGEMLAIGVAETMSAFEYHDVPLLAVIRRQPRLALLLSDPRNVWPLFHFEVDASELRAQTAEGGSRRAVGVGPTAGSSVLEDATADAEEVYSFGADLDVTLRNTAHGLFVRVLYNVDVFDQDAAADLVHRYLTALTRLAADGVEDRPAAALFAGEG